MSYIYEYPRPAVTVDVVLLKVLDNKLKVLLIQRKMPPFENRWALPGGFLDIDEELETAARRELYEETGLKIGKLLELGAFAKIGRDPRGRTLSVAYLSIHISTSALRAKAGDDAAEVGWFSVNRPPRLAFDHGEILRKARRQLRVLANDPTRLVKQLLPARASAEQLYVLFQAIRSDLERDAVLKYLQQLD
jgi:8-oxo-dGTP diphosphatase